MINFPQLVGNENQLVNTFAFNVCYINCRILISIIVAILISSNYNNNNSKLLKFAIAKVPLKAIFNIEEI